MADVVKVGLDVPHSGLLQRVSMRAELRLGHLPL